MDAPGFTVEQPVAILADMEAARHP